MTHVHRALRRRPRLVAAAAVPFAAVALVGCNLDAGTGLLVRDLDPIVLSGAQLAPFVGKDPGDLVAFRYDSERYVWDQVPVQVDERHVERLVKLRDGSGTTGPTTLAYSDPAANAGGDPNPAFDANDEVALMADDTGWLAPGEAGYPAGVVPGSGLVLKVADPLTSSGDRFRGTGLGYIYLFERSGALDPAAGVDYVEYTFAPADPTGHVEDSTVVTDRYTTHFAARWVRDRLTLGGGPDILDRHRNLFALGLCGRSEDTFSAGEGGYATNIDGPVRAIRSYLGANSGTYTQREHVFYRGTERIQTFLRVHPIPGILDMYDFSPAAVGMTYSSSSTPNGVTVDGLPDVIGATAPSWEAITGHQGALISTSRISTTATGLTIGAFYSDDSTPSTTQCTGDAYEYGASGTSVSTAIPNTDPAASGEVHTFTGTRWNVYVPAGDLVDIDLHRANLTRPLTTTVSLMP